MKETFSRVRKGISSIVSEQTFEGLYNLSTLGALLLRTDMSRFYLARAKAELKGARGTS